jgi:hypothetical protein
MLPRTNTRRFRLRLHSCEPREVLPRVPTIEERRSRSVYAGEAVFIAYLVQITSL